MWLIWTAVGYALGSISFAWLIARSHGVDLRQVGSGNLGATNVGRAVGRRWGVLCFGLDVGKGLLPVVLAGWWLHTLGRVEMSAAEAGQWLSVGAAAVLGHMFPIWHGFRGGKGVATGAGVVLGYFPVLSVPTLIALVVWGVVAKLTRYVSLASLVAAAAIPISLLGLAAWRGQLVAVWPFAAVSVALVVLVVMRHTGNIARLWAGTEAKIGEPARSVEEDTGSTPR